MITVAKRRGLHDVQSSLLPSRKVENIYYMKCSSFKHAVALSFIEIVFLYVIKPLCAYLFENLKENKTYMGNAEEYIRTYD